MKEVYLKILHKTRTRKDYKPKANGDILLYLNEAKLFFDKVFYSLHYPNFLMITRI